MKRTVIILASLFAACAAYAQTEFGGVVRLDKTVHDFGTVDVKDGAVSCSFAVTNIGEDTLNIFAVTSTCGCTTAKWTRTDIAPGEAGQIDVTFTNDEGPYPFDKTLTVYLSALSRPVILHIKGTAVKGRKAKK